mgnify:CR=1 FL=1|tara:strand:+ start:53530 stop:54834 length:1305 start_codon:yes stop_codon:yes gene_type:complete
MVKILVIGDLHFKAGSPALCDLVAQKIIERVHTQKPEMVIFLGDNNDTHEKLNMFVLNKLVRLFKYIASICPTILIIGNHDRPDSTTYLTEESAFYCLKGFPNIFVADSVLDYNHEVPGSKTPIRFLFVPYVPPGSFNATIANVKVPIDDATNPVTAIFCHQTFVGTDIGSGNKSRYGDRWSLNSPLIISGHIHTHQRPQANIIYPGTPYQQSDTDESEKIILVCDFHGHGTPKIGSLKLDVRKRRTIKIKSTEVDSFIPPTDCQVKVDIEGSWEDIEALTKRGVIAKMRSQGVAVCLTPERSQHNRNPDGKTCQELLIEMIEDDPEAKKVYLNIFKPDTTKMISIAPAKNLDVLLSAVESVPKFQLSGSFSKTERGATLTQTPSYQIDLMEQKKAIPILSPGEIQSVMNESIEVEKNKPAQPTILSMMNDALK